MAKTIRKRLDEKSLPRDAFGIWETSEYSHLLTEGDFPFLEPLPSHSLAITDQPESTPTEIPLVSWNPLTSQLEIRNAAATRMYITKVAFEIATPAFSSSKLMEYANQGKRVDIFDVRWDEDYRNRHADIYVPTAGLKEPVRSQDRSVGGVDPSASRKGKTTGAETNGLKEIWAARAEMVNDVSSNPLYAVAWLNPDYDGGKLESPNDIIIGGGQIGATAPEILSLMSSLNSQFDSNNDLDSGLAATPLITGIVVIGTAIVFTYADDIDPATATTGGMMVYKNGVFTECLLSAAATATALYALEYDRENERVVACGKGGKVFAANRTSLTVLSDISDAAITDDMIDIDFGNSAGYVATNNGNAYTLTGSVLTDITAVVVGTIAPSELNSVHYLGNQHIAFGGASGFWSETLDGGDNWDAEQLNAGLGNVFSIAGETWRTFIAIDDTVFERSVLTLQGEPLPEELVWRKLDFEGNATLSDNISDMKLLTWMNGPNVLAIVDLAGAISYMRPVVQQF